MLVETSTPASSGVLQAPPELYETAPFPFVLHKECKERP